MLVSHTWSNTLTGADMALPGVVVGQGVGFSSAQNHNNKSLEKSYGALELAHQFQADGALRSSTAPIPPPIRSETRRD